MAQIRLIIFSVVLGCCNSPAERTSSLSMDIQTIPEIQLPLKIRCDNFPGVIDSINSPTVQHNKSSDNISIYFGKILKGDLTILIKNKIQSPILYTLSKAGLVVDSLVLFDRLCYIGTDSHYLPWINITKDLTVIRTDTSYYSGLNNTLNPLTKKNELTLSSDSTITTDIFKIDNFGKITKTK
jgi:hypothetical protein